MATSLRMRLVGSALLVLLVTSIAGVPDGVASAGRAAPVTQVSADPYTNVDAYHRTQVEADTFSFGSTVVAAFQSGRYPNGAATNICAATTTDGSSWSSMCLPGTTVAADPPGTWARVSDPSIAYDPMHDVWMISSVAVDASVRGKALLISRSTDGGRTWQEPVTVSAGGDASFYDKDWVTCDTWSSSPSFGTCHVEWDDKGLGEVLLMSRSTDGGRTWMPSSTPGSAVIGGQPVVQPNGTVIVPISDAAGTTLETFVSTDGGVSYTGPHVGPPIQVHGASGMRYHRGLVSAEVDAGGTVYIVWSDCRFHAGCSVDDIVMTTTTDGITFPPVVKIPTAPQARSEPFLPGIGVDRTTWGASARLGVTFYFLRDGTCSIGTCRLGAGFVASTDGGATWSPFRRILGPIAETWLPRGSSGSFVGDYVSTSFGSNHRAYPVIANATFTGTDCVVGDITSCDEFMVAPANGLAAAGRTTRPGDGAAARSVGP